MPSDSWYHEVEQEISALRRRTDQLLDRPAQPAARHQLRLAITVRSPYDDSYPAESDEPNTYWIVFLDGSFPEDTPGKLAPTYKLRQAIDAARTTAHNIRDAYVPRGTPIRVSIHNAQWWFEYGGIADAAVASSLYSSSGPSSSGPSSSGPSSSGPSSSGPSSSGQVCHQCFDGLCYTDLPIVLDPDYVLGVKDGCLVLTPTKPCVTTNSGSSS